MDSLTLESATIIFELIFIFNRYLPPFTLG
jgi:hypothetical protein